MDQPSLHKAHSPPTKSQRLTHGKTKVAQLLDIQAVLFERILDKEAVNKDLSALACAWERLENRLGRLRMKPEPKPVDPVEYAAAKNKGRAAKVPFLSSSDPSGEAGKAA